MYGKVGIDPAVPPHLFPLNSSLLNKSPLKFTPAPTYQLRSTALTKSVAMSFYNILQTQNLHTFTHPH